MSDTRIIVSSGGNVLTTVNESPAAITSISGASANIEVEDGPAATFTIRDGIQGPQGEQGEPGIDAFYQHDQMVASNTWTITHNLNKYPSVTVVTSAGDEVIGDVYYVSANTIQLSFSSPFGGKAYLN